MMKAPGWYPSHEYPGREQWWDGSQFTSMTRWDRSKEDETKPEEAVLVNPPKKNTSLLPPKKERVIQNDWLKLIPLLAAAASLLWIAFAAAPFVTGERSVAYEKVNATIVSVKPKVTSTIFGKHRSDTQCTVRAFFIMDGKTYHVDAGNSCLSKTDMKRSLTYDPKDVEGTASDNWMPAANINFIAAISSLGVSLASAGGIIWIRKPAEGVRQKSKKRKRKQFVV